MRIGIEAQRIFRKNKHGMDFVVLQEIKELQKLDTKNEYFVFVAPGDDRCLESTNNVHIMEIGSNFYPLWEQKTLPHAAQEMKLDMLHCTSNTAPIHCSVPLLLTLHDIIFLEPTIKLNLSVYQNLGRIYRRYVLKRVFEKCERIITVSEFEYNNIITQLSIPKEKMVMIYNAYSEWFTPASKADFTYKEYIDEPGYIFFLGNTDPKKNTENTILAYKVYLEKSKIKRKLLLADLDRAYLNEILIRNHIESIRKMIVTSGYIANQNLPNIYNSAFVFLYTSQREGFGIPILESMACGTPVITSNTSSMPEIGGPYAILVNPENPDEIAEMMLKLETDDEFYQQQEEVGLQRAKLFSWRNTAERLLEVYEEVYKELKRSGK
jgi:glycosyltransferase involved in cell wall biosynthesis